MSSLSYSIFYDFYLKLKNILLVSSFIFQLFVFDYIYIVVSTLVNVVNDNVVFTLSNVVNIEVEIYNVDSTLFHFVNSNVDANNVVLTLIWRCPTSWRHINLGATLKQHWNVCLEKVCIFSYILYMGRFFSLDVCG